VLHKPRAFDPAKKYPLIDSPYPGPSSGGVRGWHFHLDRQCQPLAELGFLVFSIDAMGTPGRSRAFWDVWYDKSGDAAGLGEFGIVDHVAAIRQLAALYPQIDLNRVGIWGHSGGGGAALNAILRFPDLFKVAVATAGNHDIRGYAYDWGEKWQGVLTRNADGADNYELLANQRLAPGLKGKLLLAYGGMDDNVHPNLTWLVIQQLIENNKDFDLIVMPDENHTFNLHPYMIRRTWDYFVKNLLGDNPPKEYLIRGPSNR
jgi:dipeptidyl aminopeptidase/acylaminoacyl peptidase